MIELKDIIDFTLPTQTYSELETILKFKFTPTFSKTDKLGYFRKDYYNSRVYKLNTFVNTICTRSNPYFEFPNGELRKLSANELLKLMGFFDLDMLQGFSDTQLIKQAGNSIVVPVIEHIYRDILKLDPNEHYNLFELFSGIGAPRKAMSNLGIQFTSLGYSEIDRSAIKSYQRIHNAFDDINYGDITKIASLPTDIDILFHGSPCQDFSVLGKGRGGEAGSGTRSSLLFETVRLVEHAEPNTVIWENVKGVLTYKHLPTLCAYEARMESLGYNTARYLINSIDFIPQHRERIFVISTLK